MKLQTALLALILLAGCSQQPSNADTTPATARDDATVAQAEPMPAAADMSDADHQKMGEAKPTDMSDAEHAKMGKGAAVMATGTVDSVDGEAGTITISHGPVAALGWPAMTMAFKSSPEQVASVKVGQKVEFEFTSQGTESTITRMTPQQ